MCKKKTSKKLRLFLFEDKSIFHIPRIWVICGSIHEGFFVKNYEGLVSFFINNNKVPRLFSPFIFYNFYNCKHLAAVRSVMYSQVYFLKANTIFPNIIWDNKSIYGSSFKSNLVLLNRTGIYLTIKLPSGSIKKFLKDKSQVVGENLYRKKKKKIQVRGIVKNPVDHPNGGSSRSRNPYYTPWGKVAKRGR